jgi:hypothetical protein
MGAEMTLDTKLRVVDRQALETSLRVFDRLVVRNATGEVERVRHENFKELVRDGKVLVLYLAPTPTTRWRLRGNPLGSQAVWTPGLVRARVTLKTSSSDRSLEDSSRYRP